MTPRPRGSGNCRASQGAGFPTVISANIAGWLQGHAAFVVPIAFALYRVTSMHPGWPPTRPRATDGASTRQAFSALRSAGNAEIPTNLRILYSLPTVFVMAYWRRVLASPRGELWFGAHSRAAPEEMGALAHELREAVRRTGRATPDLDRLLAAST